MAPTSWRKKLAAVKKVCRDIGSMSRQAVCCDRCRDKQQYVATDVATSSSMLRPMSRQAAVCRDIDDQCCDKKALWRPETLQKQKKNRNLIFLTKFQAHFTLGPYIYSFFRKRGNREDWRASLMGFLSLDCPFFHFFTEKVSPLQ